MAIEFDVSRILERCVIETGKSAGYFQFQCVVVRFRGTAPRLFKIPAIN